MNLNIQIDSSTFEKVIKDGIAALTKEEVKELIVNAIKEAFKTLPDYRNMLVVKEDYAYGSGTRYQLGRLAEEAFKDASFSEELEPLRKKMIEDLIANHRAIVEGVIFRNMISSLCDDYQFRETMRIAASQVLDELRRNEAK